MTSLAETYGSAGSDARRRLLLGTALFVAGAVLVVVGIVVASTGALGAFGVGRFAAREFAGVVAGLGVPAVFVGVFAVLPASRRERAAAGIGASVAVLGVALFVYAYPGRWIGSGPDHLTFPVVVVYFLGTITTFWALFTAIVNVKARDPGGTVTLQRIIRRAAGEPSPPRSDRGPGGTPDSSSVGSVGVVGDVGREEVADEDDAELLAGGDSDDRPASTGGGSSGRSAGAATPTSDGGAQAERIETPRPGDADSRDRYCGNCAHFEYVPTDEGIQPYCGLHEELMDDMEACQQWEATDFVE